MKINANTIRVGNILEHQGKLWRVAKTEHTKPGKGGAFMQVEMKGVDHPTKLNERFRADESVEQVRLDQTEYQFLYEDGDDLVLMDQVNFEQVTIPKDLLGDTAPFLQDGMIISVESYNEKPISVALPEKVTCTIEETEAVVKGQTAASSNKPAILDNGVRVMVPPFVSQGDAVVVRVEDQTYVERA